MKILTALLLLLSTNVLAEDIDLTKDAMYYCIDSISSGIQGKKVSTFTAEKYTLKIKDEIVTFNTPAEITSSDKSVLIIYDDMISLSAINGKLSVELKKGVINFYVYFTLTQKNGDVNQYISQGTCTKW